MLNHPSLIRRPVALVVALATSRPVPFPDLPQLGHSLVSSSYKIPRTAASLRKLAKSFPESDVLPIVRPPSRSKDKSEGKKRGRKHDPPLLYRLQPPHSATSLVASHRVGDTRRQIRTDVKPGHRCGWCLQSAATRRRDRPRRNHYVPVNCAAAHGC